MHILQSHCYSTDLNPTCPTEVVTVPCTISKPIYLARVSNSLAERRLEVISFSFKIQYLIVPTLE